MNQKWFPFLLFSIYLALGLCSLRADTTVRGFLSRYCVSCHDDVKSPAALDLTELELSNLNRADSTRAVPNDVADTWEKVAKKLRLRMMPPSGADLPNEAEYQAVLTKLTHVLDQRANRTPRPGRTSTLRRLTRLEYQNAIRDLFNIEIDAADYLPEDEMSHGFDNVTVSELSPTRLNRYLIAAKKIAQLAVGRVGNGPASKSYRVPGDRTQEKHVAGLPLGTRGGALIRHTFPTAGKYEIRVRLARDRNEHVDGLNGTHQLDLMLNRRLIKSFTIKRPDGDAQAKGEYEKPSHANVDAHLHATVTTSAGLHEIGIAFVNQSSSLLESKRQPLNVRFNFYRHRRLTPAIFQVTVTGPIDGSAAAGLSVVKSGLFPRRPRDRDDEIALAKSALSKLMRRAYRRPTEATDFVKPLQLFVETRQTESFAASFEAAISSVLVSPHFLFRIERTPHGRRSGEVYQINDVELASRLSFFLWSSIPDNELLLLAEQQKLSDPSNLERQVRRMLRDPKAQSLSGNFAGQWLHLKNLKSVSPDMRRYPDFDDNLRNAMRRETELFFDHIIQGDRSALELLEADYSFLNERLARHYGLTHIYGSHFRQVQFPPNARRGGLLRHASILTVTSYANRTSPVLRGKWVLENLLGSPPPPPPDDVPDLKENTVDLTLSTRERLAQHRADPSCAVCHDAIDPVGFSFENYDAVGQWRDFDDGIPVDATADLARTFRYSGSVRDGVAKLERSLTQHPEIFIGTLVEKLLTYALGRGIEPADGPAVRAIFREARLSNFRFASIVLGITKSVPFQMRVAP